MGVRLLLRRALQPGSLRASLVLLAVALAAITAVAPSEGATSSRSAPAAPTALTARTEYLNLKVNMHLVGRPARVFNEQGSVTGTMSGSAYSRNTAISTTEGAATFTLYLKSGSISGKATPHERLAGATVYFSGIASITGGTGSWAHAAGSSLRFAGAINRQNLKVSETLTGTVND